MIKKQLNKIGFNDIQVEDLKAYQAMIEAQKLMHQHHEEPEYNDVELVTVKEYRLKHQAYLEFLQQKSKLNWITTRDENTTLFHQSIKARKVHNYVYAIRDMYGIWHNKLENVTRAFISYYRSCY